VKTALSTSEDKNQTLKKKPSVTRQSLRGRPSVTKQSLKTKSVSRQTLSKPESRQTLKSQYTPQEPCFHCGSLKHTIYRCRDYHDFYFEFYLPESEKYFNNFQNINHTTVSASQTKTSDFKKFNCKISQTEPKTVWVPKCTN
jgi:hypothetical protein